jgi:hypothetical protein
MLGQGPPQGGLLLSARRAGAILSHVTLAAHRMETSHMPSSHHDDHSSSARAGDPPAWERVGYASTAEQQLVDACERLGVEFLDDHTISWTCGDQSGPSQGSSCHSLADAALDAITVLQLPIDKALIAATDETPRPREDQGNRPK